MFVLRVEAGGTTTETPWTAPEGAIGSGAKAAVRREDAGWAPVEAWAWSRDATVVVLPGDGSRPRTLAVGDTMELGSARLTLDRAPAPEPGSAAAPPPLPRQRRRRFARDRDFGSELFARLRRSPWLLLSAGLHALAVVASVLLAPDVAPPSAAGAALVARLDPSPFPDPALPDVPEEGEPPPAFPPPPEPEPDSAHRSDPVLVDRTDPEPAWRPEEDLLAMPAPPERLPEAPDASIARVRRRAAAPAPTPPAHAETVPDADHVNHDHALADGQNRRAAEVVLADVRRRGGHLASVLRALRPEDVLVVKGAFDEMERTFEALELPYTLRLPADLEEGYDLSRHRLVFWSCGEFPTRTRRAQVAAEVRRFVQGGGHLLTTDWMVSNLLVEAFPGTLASQGREHPLPEAVVSVRPAPGAEAHPLLEGVFVPGATSLWWLEATTHGVSVKDPARVETLIEAPGIADRLGSPSDAVALTFSYGRGRVLHLLGHYYQKEGSLAGTIATQRIALNLIGLRFAK